MRGGISTGSTWRRRAEARDASGRGDSTSSSEWYVVQRRRRSPCVAPSPQTSHRTTASSANPPTRTAPLGEWQHRRVGGVPPPTATGLILSVPIYLPPQLLGPGSSTELTPQRHLIDELCEVLILTLGDNQWSFIPSEQIGWLSNPHVYNTAGT